MTREVWDKCQIPDKSVVFPRECWGGIWGRTLLEGQSIIAEGDLQVPPGHVPLHCVMAVPIVQREQVIGQFILANKEGGYSPDDLALLENIAEQVAPILRAHLDRIRQQALQEELELVNRQLHKQESLARMAGAVAHNYNNKLMVILGNLEMALAELPAGASLVRSSLEDAQAASVQLSELGRDMLAYLGQSHSARPCPTIDLVDLVNRYAGECRSNLPARVALELRVPAEPLPVAVEPDHIRRALDRLVANALESLNEAGGRIEVSVERADPAAMEDGYQIPIDWQPSARSYVGLTVGDSGCGMDQEELEHIFDPFYTKKFIGRGMGLPLTLGIVRQYEGMITVVSEPGGGSAFTLYLPLAGSEG
jgi:signal transduction histidine kinase